MVLQGETLPNDSEIIRIKSEVTQRRNTEILLKANQVERNLEPNVLRGVQHSKEKGASNWLSAIPLADQGFTLNKGEFRDAISLRYDKTLRRLPSKCSCGQVYNVTHALNCKKGVIIRHNNIRDLEANLLRKVCNDVETEPKLQPVSGEQTSGLTGDEARPDIRARGIWRPGQNGYFDVRITNLNADSQKHLKSDFETRKREERTI